MMDTAQHLAVLNLGCIRQQKKLFAGLSFALAPGEMLLVEGPNGSGKSSLLRLLTGLSTPSLGDIFWHGESIQQARTYAEQLHYVGHANGIKLGLTVAENVRLMQHLEGTDHDVAPLIEQLQLTTHLHTLARHLSAGQKRRLALLKLFLHPKSLWIVDEPLTALDTATQAFFLSQLQQHLQQGGLCVLSSHHPISLDNVIVKTVRLSVC